MNKKMRDQHYDYVESQLDAMADQEHYSDGDSRRCRRHPGVQTSSSDGMHDTPCNLCESEMDDDEPAPVSLDGPFARWCEEVVHLVAAHDRAKGRLEREPAIQYLYRCRCDEPQDAWEAGDSPATYAAFVMNPRSGGTLDPTEVL